VELRSSGLGAAAISYDPREVLADFSSRRGITFPLLSDVDSAVIKDFGILNTVVAEGLGPERKDPVVAADVATYVAESGSDRGWVGIPFPGTFLLDSKGRVASRSFEEYYRERITTSNVLLKIGQGLSPVEATETTTAHLKLTAYPSNWNVSTGARISVAVEVTPDPDIHVYAPGAEAMGYRVVGLRLAAIPHLRFDDPVDYPESEIYHFKPLDERVPVYQRPFTLLQDLVVGATWRAESALAGVKVLTLTGSFDYQACDHEVCFPPESVPLSFALDLESHDTRRAKGR